MQKLHPHKTYSRWLSELIAAFLILLFLYTAITKLKAPHTFAAALAHSPLLGNFATTLSWLVPFTELIIVALLILPSTRRTGLWWSAGLMLMFTAYILYMLLTQSTLPCTCGGVLEQWNWRTHFWFNTATTMGAFAAAIFYTKNFVTTKQGMPKTCEQSRLLS